MMLYILTTQLLIQEGGNPYGSNYGPVSRVEKMNNNTVKVIYKEPYAPALESWGMGIIPKHILEKNDTQVLTF